MPNFEVSQSTEILAAKKTQGYPIQKEEWAYIKDKIGIVGRRDESYNSIGFLLAGGGLSGIFSVVSQPSSVFYWVLTICCFICGLLCLHFAKSTVATQNYSIDNLIEYMEIIEEKFIDSSPRHAPVPTASTVSLAPPQASPREIIKEVISLNPDKTAAEIASLSSLDRATVAGYISSLYQGGDIIVSGTGKPKKFKIKGA